MKFVKFVKSLVKYLPLLLVLCSLVILRVVNLGYSEYQGDEIQALYLPKNDQTLLQFLLDQKKGPIQYLVTASIKNISNNYHNIFLTRLPFALAGIGAGICLYLFVRGITNSSVGLLVLIFYSINGIFVAFSRIVQYQTLVALFTTLTLYFVQRFCCTQKRAYLYGAYLFWGLGLLTHSDAMFIFLPVLALLLSWGKENHATLKNFISFLLLPSLLLLMILLGYYIPLVMNASGHTQNYWLGRFSGDITNGIISSTYLFSVYQPVYGLQFYIVLGIIGLIFWFLAAINLNRFKSCRIIGRILLFSNVGNNLPNPLPFVGVLLWFGSALVFMEIVTKFPGTHIWTYLLPLIVFIGYGLERLLVLLKRPVAKTPYVVAIILISTFFFYQSFVIFVDHSKEYPWERKPLLFWELKKPNTGYQLSLFGFPYYRGWKNIAEYLENDGRSNYYWDNEKASLSRFYIPLERNNQKAGYFIKINRPQTFTGELLNKRGASWIVLNSPIKVFYNKDGRQVASIYLVPESWGI